ncbi:hypothetical protein CU102_19595 [Phyllobacterium brassicacearum]|uniref:DUF4239 domain-containing protein n=1 Tax=Phyllobacterium brassicacearum TaxID=314235 RepID=A0A2P7BGX0_9HYPH|nr:DUF4239 domain-containing protein [Phyllobacterium brassicacearum]PSH65697.1 hypothetical protein CU102_19595 [Phyllobacterium brassicacearum]TDQ10395.1 uncharacterized protein DUF4239 [Phyllobacterium brassicacearum]
MAGIAIAWIVFVCVSCGALLGMLLRRILPEHHLNNDSKDVLKLGMGLLATLAALVLGLLIASSKSQYDTQRDGLDQVAAKLILVDAGLALYGPKAAGARNQFRHTVASALNHIWPNDSSLASSLTASDTTAGATAVYNLVQELSPQDDTQRRLQSQALQLLQELGQTRWLLVAQQESGVVPLPFLIILVFWLTVLFASFGLLSPPNATIIGVLFVCALSVSAAIFLILELGRPFEGTLQLSSAPIRHAFERIGQ